jgi:hypothetical protein
MAHDKTLSRRSALKIGLSVLPLAASGVALLNACGSSALECSDVSGLTPAEAATRTNLEYTEASPHGEAKDCLNCRFFTGNQSQCGSCTLVKGPINPRGYCKSWVVKA